MRQALLIVTLAITLAAPAPGCGDASEAACRVGADCASGVCLGDGTCAPIVPTGDADHEVAADVRDTSAEGDVEAPSDATRDATGDRDGTLEVAPGVCVPVDDERVSRAEVPLRAGLYATFRIATDVEVDLAGEVEGARRAWDLAGPFTGDADARVDLRDPVGAWWATDFPGATYAARLSSTEDYLGVFEVNDEALLLRGVVSPEDGLFATRLTYDPPVTVLSFPLEIGQTWTSDTTITGLTLGVPSFANEAYASTVDAAGALRTPFGTFDVLRVRTTLTRTVGLVVTTLRQVAFVAPCFGTVALVVSRAGEPDVEFSEAAELRRLAP